jgi:hypothetical protein
MSRMSFAWALLKFVFKSSSVSCDTYPHRFRYFPIHEANLMRFRILFSLYFFFTFKNLLKVRTVIGPIMF